MCAEAIVCAEGMYAEATMCTKATVCIEATLCAGCHMHQRYLSRAIQDLLAMYHELRALMHHVR
jgi:hypothetical protein